MESVEDLWNQIEGKPKRLVTAIVIGCGQRGQNYSQFSLELPNWLKLVAVADPLQHRREKIAKSAGISDSSFIVNDWKKLESMDKISDCAIITTQDQMHRDPAIAFANKGYHILLEKPMSVDEKECDDIANACEENNTILAVCHVLRYFPPVLKIREIIDQGLIGEIVTVDHRENILWWHFAHSFVRGNWRNVKSSTFSLLAKSCHDIDLIMYWMGDQKCTKIQSFGSLKHFKSSGAPSNAGKTCYKCPQDVEKACPYSAKKIYDLGISEVPRWPMSVVCDIEDHPGGYREALKEALETGPYGKCVYQTDNDVVDHQVVNMEFENEATASFTMNAFTKDMRRETRICGTRGELSWDGSENGAIIVYDFANRKQTEIFPDKTLPMGSKLGGHGGADFFLVSGFVKAVANNEPELVRSGIKDSLRSHKLVFAAERSRLNNSIEKIDI